MEEKRCSLGVSVSDFSQIIIFGDKETFDAAIKENPHLKPMVGADIYENSLFPNLFIAGVVKTSDSEGVDRVATQRQHE